MKKINTIIIVIFVFFMFLEGTYGQRNNTSDAIGFYSGFGLNSHKVNFSHLPKVPNCCPSFDGANGFGGRFSGFWETHFYDNLFFRTEFGFEIINADFESDELIMIDDDKTEALVRHNLDINIITANIGAGISYYLLDNLFLKALISSGMPVIKHFNQIETLIKPDYGTFENGSRTRNKRKGDITNTPPLLISANFGIGWDIFLNYDNSLIFSPSLDYEIGLNSFINDYNWFINNFYIGISVKYIFKEAVSSQQNSIEPYFDEPQPKN